MKVAVYFGLPYGGAYRSTEEICKRLASNHQVSFFENKSSLYYKKNRLLSDLNSLVLERVKQKQLAKKIDSEDFDLVFVTHDEHLQAPWVLRYLKTKTVFLCQEPTRAFFEKFLDINPNLPLINRFYEKINRFFRKRTEIKNAQFATKIIANSNYSVESIFRAYGVTATPIYLGIDSKQFYPQRVKRQNQVLIVGNDEPQKGLRYAIDSLSLIPNKIRPILLIASPRSVISSDLVNYSKNKQVKIKNVSNLSPEKLCSIYNQSKITLATAFLEPFGLSVIESMACGTPVVAVCEGGFRETITNKKTGLLSKRDPQKIAEAISLLLSDKILYKKITHQGIIRASKYFSWDKTVNEFEKVLHETTKK